MLLQVPDVLSPAEVQHCRRVLAAAEWVDGSVTAGFQSTQVKHNAQIAEGSPAARGRPSAWGWSNTSR